MEKGLVQVYTGDGKGKTTAALGAALRAVGHGFRVLILQFMKGRTNYGESESARNLSPYLTIQAVGREGFVSKARPDPVDREKAREGLALARRALESREYDMVILDEINMAVDYGLVEVSEVIELIDLKPPSTELILTGRNARAEILEKADLVTEMIDRKHYFDQGILARKGIEF